MDFNGNTAEGIKGEGTTLAGFPFPNTIPFPGGMVNTGNATSKGWKPRTWLSTTLVGPGKARCAASRPGLCQRQLHGRAIRQSWLGRQYRNVGDGSVASPLARIDFNLLVGKALLMESDSQIKAKSCPKGCLFASNPNWFPMKTLVAQTMAELAVSQFNFFYAKG
jgi:hypothetical protein